LEQPLHLSLNIQRLTTEISSIKLRINATDNLPPSHLEQLRIGLHSLGPEMVSEFSLSSLFAPDGSKMWVALCFSGFVAHEMTVKGRRQPLVVHY